MMPEMPEPAVPAMALRLTLAHAGHIDVGVEVDGFGSLQRDIARCIINSVDVDVGRAGGRQSRIIGYAAGGYDVDVGRVEQPAAGLAFGSGRIDGGAGYIERAGRRGFDEAAVAAVCAAFSGEMAVGAGVLVRPCDDAAAVAVIGGVGGDDRVLINGDGFGVGQRAGAPGSRRRY